MTKERANWIAVLATILFMLVIIVLCLLNIGERLEEMGSRQAVEVEIAEEAG